MYTLNRSPEGREDWPIGTAPTHDEDDQGHETDERRDEMCAATILRLDQKAAELLTALAGV